MLGDVNRVTLIGRVGTDLNHRTLDNNFEILTLSMATSVAYKDKKSGEKVQSTEWHRVAVVNPYIIKYMNKCISKGSYIFVNGSLKNNSWTDKEGVKRYSTEVRVSFDGEVKLVKNPGLNKTPFNSDNQEVINDVLAHSRLHKKARGLGI